MLRTLRRRAARDLPRQAHQALGRSSTTSRSPTPTTRPSGSSPPTGGCSRSRAWRPTAAATSRPTACAGASCAARSQAAVADVHRCPRFAAQLARAGARRRGRSRATWPARASVYLQARTHYGVVDPAALAALRGDLARRCSAPTTCAALDDAVRAADLDRRRRDRRARRAPRARYRDDHRPARPAAAGDGDGATARRTARPRRRRGSGERRRRDARRRADGRADVGSLADALEHALEHAARRPARAARRGRRPQRAARARPPRRGAAGAARRGRRDRRAERAGCPTAASTARRSPTRSQQARRYATRLRQAITARHARDRQAHARRALRRARLRARPGPARAPAGPVSTHPWQITRQITRADRGAARRAGHRHLRLDGRLRVRARPDRLDPHRRPAPDRRALRDRAVRQRRRAAQPTAPSRCALVPGIRTGGGTAFAGDAIELASDQLEMTNPRRPRFVYVLSDGGWYDTQAGVQKIRWLAEHGVPTIHITIGDRAAVGRGRPHRRHHRPRRRARPDRRRHRRRAARRPRRRRRRSRAPGPPRNSSAISASPPSRRKPPCHDALRARARALRRHHRRAPAGVDGTLVRRRARRPRARPQRRAARSPPTASSGSPRMLMPHRPARALHRPPPRPDRAASSSTPASAGCWPPAPATRSPHPARRPRAGAQPDRAAARPRARRRTRSAASRPRRTSARTSRSPTSRRSSATAGPPAPACPTSDRIAAVCADLGIGAAQGPQPAPPAHAPRADPRARRRAPGRAPALGHAGQPPRRHARRRPRAHRGRRRSAITTPRAARRARCATSARSCTARVVEDEHAYAVRIDDGALLDAAEQIARARAHLTAGRPPRSRRGCSAARPTSSTRARRARRPRPREPRASCASTPRCATAPRTGRYAYVHDRGPDFAAGIWVVDPVFMLDALREALDRRRRRSRRRARATSPARACDDARPARGRRPTTAERAPRAAPAPPAGAAEQPRPRPRPARRADRPHPRASSRRARRSSATCSPATTAT